MVSNSPPYFKTTRIPSRILTCRTAKPGEPTRPRMMLAHRRMGLAAATPNSEPVRRMERAIRDHWIIAADRNSRMALDVRLLTRSADERHRIARGNREARRSNALGKSADEKASSCRAHRSAALCRSAQTHLAAIERLVLDKRAARSAKRSPTLAAYANFPHNREVDRRRAAHNARARLLASMSWQCHAGSSHRNGAMRANSRKETR